MFHALHLLCTDPAFQIPFLGSLVASVCCSLIGSVLFVQKKTLLGETLSHAAYPGIAIGGSLGYALFSSFSLLLGGFFFTLLALLSFEFCLKKGKMTQDGAMSFLLAFFWSIGVVVVSRLQFVNVPVFREVKTFLFGQVATLSSYYLALSSLFLFFLVAGIFTFFRPLQLFLFDASFAKTPSFRILQGAFFSLFVFSMVLSMRSVGSVLMLGMLVAPPIFARQFTKKLSSLFWVASLVAIFSAFLGNLLPLLYTGKGSLPSGPLMVWVASFSAISALFLAPKRGYLYKLLQICLFRRKCHIENLIKMVYKTPQISEKEIRERMNLSRLWFFYYLWKVKKEGWIQKKRGLLFLSLEGKTKALHIVRLHRLWELYLVSHMNVKASKVHEQAEYMEHVLDEEIEKKLDVALFSPEKDPHDQPIPKV